MADKLYISETPDEVKVCISSHHCKIANWSNTDS